jgi:hypothetical protein
MNHKTLVISLLLSAAMLSISGTAISSDDSEHGGFLNRWFGGSKPGVAPVENLYYLEECGSCHFPYQPGLLPARSWSKLMAGLDDHFGENAELPAEDAKILEGYLLENSADKSSYKRSQKIMKRMLSTDTPLRITETRYFIKKHDELSRRMVQDNPQVESFSRCDSCHKQAAKGSFEEDEVEIPGFGRWEDD